MSRLITRVNIDINNANWVSRMMTRASELDQGITRAMRRVFDWICWGTYLRFSVKLAPYKIVHPEDGLSHEYTDLQYASFRAQARNLTTAEDMEEDDESKFRLINDYQFQLRLICWAEELFAEWRREINRERRPDRVVGKHDLEGRLQLSYVHGQDADGAFFYLPEFKLSVPEGWEQIWSVRDKQKAAEMIDWMAHQIEHMYSCFPYCFTDDRNVAAQAVLAQLVEADEQKYDQAQVEAYNKKQAQRHERDLEGRELLNRQFECEDVFHP
jgi:hypothetical protein